MASNVTEMNHYLGVNSFCKQYGRTRDEVLRMISRGRLKAVHFKDGNRFYIDVADVLEAAKQADMPPSHYVARICRFSKK